MAPLALGALHLLKLLFSSNTLLTGWPCGFQGVWSRVILARKAADLPWLLHPSARRLNLWSLPSSACFCPRAVIAVEAAGDLEWGRELLSTVTGGGRVFPGEGWSTWFATPLPASGVYLRCLAGALQWPATGHICSWVNWVQRALVVTITAFGSVSLPLLHQNSPRLRSGAIPV